MTPTSARMDGDLYGIRLCNYPRHAAHTMEGRRAIEPDLIKTSLDGRLKGGGDACFLVSTTKHREYYAGNSLE